MIEFLADTPDIIQRLYPFASLRKSSELRAGILTIAEKWELLLQRHSTAGATEGKKIQIPGNWIPSEEMADAINRGATPQPDKILEYPWQFFQWNDALLRSDFTLITQKRYSFPIPETVEVINPGQVFIEEGARLAHCMLNASDGPIYLDRDSEIMEGSSIRGPFSLGKGSVVKMGARIYGGTSIGPYCVVGGEIKNSLIMGYSNKAHDGYLGDSVIGEWCNLGAGTTVSNLRNSAGNVKVWSAFTEDFVEVGQKCGLLMGDHSKSAIQTAFNTGTVVGTAAQVFASGLTPKFIRDFSWGVTGERRYEWDKLLRDIANWKKLKGKVLTDQEIKDLRALYEQNR
jgi:UDP-N-acetylglucosamine diphosphorylase/glucosamine-1-phosphate N-acetyltransferase